MITIFQNEVSEGIMILKEYTHQRADAVNQLNIPAADKPYRVEFLWLEMISRDHGAEKIYYGDHSHSFFELYLLFSGDTRCGIDGKELELSTGDAILLPPNTVHRYIASDMPFTRASLAFFSRDIPLPESEYKKFRFSQEICDNVEFILKQSDKDDVFTPSVVSGRLSEIVAEVARATVETLPTASHVTEDRRVTVAKEYIHRNHDRLITGDDVAKECSISRKQLDRIFKAQTDKTVHDYLIETKVSYAKQLLLEDKSVKEISYTLGFDNESSFVSFFKRHCGVPPGAYKKENK